MLSLDRLEILYRSIPLCASQEFFLMFFDFSTLKVGLLPIANRGVTKLMSAIPNKERRFFRNLARYKLQLKRKFSNSLKIFFINAFTT